MINVAKGSAHSLYQTDKIASAASGVTTLEAGMVVQFNTDGELRFAEAGASQANKLFGFVLNNATDGDVIASGKYGVYLLDGSSIIETNKADAAITAGNYPIGTKVYAEAATGDLTTSAPHATAPVIGVVDGIRSLPDNEYGTTAMLGIKLSAN